jgi:hypothetical protein
MRLRILAFSHSQTYLVGVLAVFLFLIPGCVSLPAQQMSDARQALQAAKLADAENLAVEEYTEAKLLVDDANRFLAEGRFELARKVAERAKFQALVARRKAVKLKGTHP